MDFADVFVVVARALVEEGSQTDDVSAFMGGLPHPHRDDSRLRASLTPATKPQRPVTPLTLTVKADSVDRQRRPGGEFRRVWRNGQHVDSFATWMHNCADGVDIAAPALPVQLISRIIMRSAGQLKKSQ